MGAPSPASGGRDFSVQNLGLGNAPSGVNAGPTKRRQYWARQAASLLGPPSGVITGPAKRRHCWARQAASLLGPLPCSSCTPCRRLWNKSWFFIPPSGLRPPSRVPMKKMRAFFSWEPCPPQAEEGFFRANLGLGNAPSVVNAGPIKQRYHWARQAAHPRVSTHKHSLCALCSTIIVVL